jgi:hypothetical protein
VKAQAGKIPDWETDDGSAVSGTESFTVGGRLSTDQKELIKLSLDYKFNSYGNVAACNQSAIAASWFMNIYSMLWPTISNGFPVFQASGSTAMGVVGAEPIIVDWAVDFGSCWNGTIKYNLSSISDLKVTFGPAN